MDAAWPVAMAPVLPLGGLNMKVLPGHFGMYVRRVLCRTSATR